MPPLHAAVLCDVIPGHVLMSVMLSASLSAMRSISHPISFSLAWMTEGFNTSFRNQFGILYQIYAAVIFDSIQVRLHKIKKPGEIFCLLQALFIRLINLFNNSGSASLKTSA